MASTGRGSQVKGSKFERETAKALSVWWGATFNRTPGSGGLKWAEENNVGGDIVAPPSAGFPFIVECKKHEGWTLDNVFLNTGEPKSWWKQVVSDATRTNKIPLLMFSRNRAKSFVMLPYDDLLYNVLRDKRNTVARTTVSFKNIREESVFYDVMVFTIEELTSFSPDFLREHYSKYSWDFFYKEVDENSVEDLETGIDKMLDNLEG
ncbi:hypothetical protein LP125_131 [Listeria phage LP-125]|uniref:Resolvase n=7 Tax=Pecentumvirus TaxID=1857844 RepID=S4UCA4_9CAUD|nr:hypothetical protein QLX35_gp128 [Listeria phage LP-125]YP_009042929.1 RusA-like Holliday junction resolvase [Listeria phage LP-048]YP_009592669.1 RusA-like Holliday junction resolvase [Listeria phage LP-064]YP_010843738.1 RusA-like Holliday junction resolvase [Listeria phage WIL-1]AII27302.1 hypothetical protein [Listeria phage LMTA-34]QEP53119.2 hypothetical protein FK485_0119 [Listeria phage LP-039]QNL31886.1 hypothetical protein HUK29_0119 [Listeria phage LP-Mix_6.1]QNL32084.1 hypothe